MQIFMHPTLRTKLLSAELPPPPPPGAHVDPKQHFLRMLQTTLRQMQDQNGGNFDPIEFVRASAGQFSFMVWEQQDSSEFLSGLISNVEAAGFKDLFRELMYTQISQIETTGNETKISKVVPHCGEVIRVQTYKDGKLVPDLFPAMFEQYFPAESHTEDTHTRTVITVAPPMLVFPLGRSNGINSEKNMGQIRFDTELDLSSYLSDELKEQGVQGKYELSGIVIHRGKFLLLLLCFLLL